MLSALYEKVKNNSGKFVCSKINQTDTIKEIRFKHVYESGLNAGELEKLKVKFGHIKGLLEFYETFGNLRLYYDPASEESALYIANPKEWPAFREMFLPWLEFEDVEDLLPEWLSDYGVIGEIPGSGNYLLMPLSGEEAGNIYEFEHDGFEFIFIDCNLEACIERYLSPTSVVLTDIATHMRFMKEDPWVQWWINDLIFDDGKKVSTSC